MPYSGSTGAPVSQDPQTRCTASDGQFVGARWAEHDVRVLTMERPVRHRGLAAAEVAGHGLGHIFDDVVLAHAVIVTDAVSGVPSRNSDLWRNQ